MTTTSILTGAYGVQQFVYRRGQGDGTMMHRAGYDRLGRFSGALCGSAEAFDTSCNLTLGQPLCAPCVAAEASIANTPSETGTPAAVTAGVPASSSTGEHP